MAANNHRGRVQVRQDFIDYWKLHRLWRNPKKKFVVVKCEVCKSQSRRERLSRVKEKQLFRLQLLKEI